MKNNTLKTKILSLLITFAIAVIFSSIISTILHLIFTRVPEEIRQKIETLQKNNIEDEEDDEEEI